MRDGYCQQQAIALKRIYDQLGIEARPVYALRCRFPPAVIDGMPWPGGITPHTWLRVRIGDQERDVCPGSVSNRPGVTHFVALSRMRPLHHWLSPWSALGSSLANIQRDLAARRRAHAAAARSISYR